MIGKSPTQASLEWGTRDNEKRRSINSTAAFCVPSMFDSLGVQVPFTS